ADPQLYVPFVLSGLAPWSFLSGAFLDGCLCVRQAEKFMRVYPAPLAIYALRTVCSLSFHFLVILGICIVFSWALLGFGNLKTLIFLAPALILFLVFGLSVVQIFGILDIYFPDNKHIMQMGLQMLFYMLPIIYPPESLNSELFRNVLHYNPLGAFILLI